VTARTRILLGRVWALIVGIAVVVAVMAIGTLLAPTARSEPRQPPSSIADHPRQRPSMQPPLSGPLALPSRPQVVATTVTIPAIGVSSPLEMLRLNGQRVLQPPQDYQRAGWYGGGPVPGDPGPAVIAGHVDSTSGPAVFSDLGHLHRGDAVLVGRSDGRTVRFVVASVLAYPKDSFPTAAVYGPTPVATLRLITCGGVYDHARHRYTDDIVVYAEEA
jgi:sortase (surface protein transpeptidase)